MRTNTLPAKQTDPTVRCQELGDELLRLRKTAHLSVRQVAHITCIDPSAITRFEKGQRPPTIRNLKGLLTAYRADRPTRQRLETLAEEAHEPGWWQRNCLEPTARQHTVTNLEAKAQRIVNFELALIPGLLQTGDYTRALMRSCNRSESDIEVGMAARFCRQSVLEQWDAPELVAIVDETALRRVVGGPVVMRRQLDYLVESCRKKRITLRLVPSKDGHPGVDGSSELIELPHRPPVVFVDQAASVLFIEHPDEVAVYQRILEGLLARALDEPQSVQTVVGVAQGLRTEEGTDEAQGSESADVAQKQLQQLKP